MDLFTNMLNKRILFICLIICSIAVAGKIKFISDHCNVYFNTRTHEFSYDKKCLQQHGKKMSGFSFECRQPTIKDGKLNISTSGTYKVLVILSEYAKPDFIAFKQGGELIFQYDVSNFALDINSGVLKDCTFNLDMKIEEE